MEPRARAGKNVGKMNFGFAELRQILYGSGDAREPLPETMRLLDEIATDFIQSLSFEAARIGHYSGRQKIKYEDFEFALRRNPLFLGKVREMFEMSKEVKDARKMPGIGEGNLAKGDMNDLAKLGDEDGDAKEAEDKDDTAGGSKKRKGDGAGSKKKKAKTAGKGGKNAGKTESASAEPAESAGLASAEPAEPEASGDVAAKDEPDAEEPSLDALFGDMDDDDVFGDGPADSKNEQNGQNGQTDGASIKNEDGLGDIGDLDGLF